MAVQAQRRTRQATPARWQKAARRAAEEKIEVRQLNNNGMWIATSGTQANVAYMLEISQGVVQSCTCPAGQFGDPCCKHAARYYLSSGTLALDPEPEPPAPGLVPCWACDGAPSGCPVCAGAGLAAIERQAASLLAAAA